MSHLTPMRIALGLVLVAAVADVALGATRYSGDAEAFDFGVEVDGDMATLYLAVTPTNEPFVGTAPKLVPDDEALAPMVFAPTADPGVFTLQLGEAGFPEGQLEVAIDGTAEATDIYEVEAGAHDSHEGHDHSHGAKKRTTAEVLRSGPVVGLGFFGVFMVGLFVGRLRGRGPKGNHVAVTVEAYASAGSSGSAAEAVRRSSAIIACLLLGAAFGGRPAQADEGHTHATIEIDQGGGAASEVTISKKSQFLIQLRTQAAKTAPVTDTLETFGHLAPKPQLDASIKAPVSGFLRLGSDLRLGSKVRKGQVVGHLEGVSTIQLVTPVAGTVVELAAVPGARAEAGDVVLRVVDTSTLWIDAEVFQKDLIRLGSAVDATILLEGTSQPIQGKVLGVKSAVDENTLTAKVYVEIANPDGTLPLGGLANVTFPLPSTAGEGMIFPKSAVLNRGGETIVYVQTGAETFVAKPVSTRFGTGPDVVVVTKGLAEGDRVVVKGGYQVLVGAH